MIGSDGITRTCGAGHAARRRAHGSSLLQARSAICRLSPPSADASTIRDPNANAWPSCAPSQPARSTSASRGAARRTGRGSARHDEPGEQVALIHRHRGDACLPQTAASALAEIDLSGITGDGPRPRPRATPRIARLATEYPKARKTPDFPMMTFATF